MRSKISHSLRRSVQAAPVLVAILLAACGSMSRVVSNVESFSRLQPSATPRTVAVLPFADMDGDSLQWRAFADMVSPHLAAKGLVPAARDDADYLVYLGFSIDSGVTEVSTRTRADVQSVLVSNPASGADFNAPSMISVSVPTTRVETTEREVFTRVLMLAMTDRRTGERAWEVRTVSKGRCGALSGVIDEMLVASFRDFPATFSGEITVDFDGQC